MDVLKLRFYVFDFFKEKDIVVIKMFEVLFLVIIIIEEEKGNVKFVVGIIFNREKIGDLLIYCIKIELVVKIFWFSIDYWKSLGV